MIYISSGIKQNSNAFALEFFNVTLSKSFALDKVIFKTYLLSLMVYSWYGDFVNSRNFHWRWNDYLYCKFWNIYISSMLQEMSKIKHYIHVHLADQIYDSWVISNETYWSI